MQNWKNKVKKKKRMAENRCNMRYFWNLPKMGTGSPAGSGRMTFKRNRENFFFTVAGM